MTAPPAHSCPTCGALERVLFDSSGAVGEGETEGGFAEFAAPDLPELFGEYALEGELGGGGMGVVHEAEHVRLKRTVALKMVRAFFLNRADDLVRFRTEAEAVARLDHPNIVPIYEIGEANGQPFFTMKLMEGGSLAERLKRGPLASARARRRGCCSQWTWSNARCSSAGRLNFKPACTAW